MSTRRTRRPRGTGSLYKREGIWYLRVTHGGREIRKSTGKKFKREAEAVLQAVLADLRGGSADPFAARKATLSGLIELHRHDGANSYGPRALAALHGPLIEFFGERALVQDITTARLRAYGTWRRAQRARLTGKPISPKTVYLELSALRRMMKLGAEEKPPLVREVPKFPSYRQRPGMEDRYLDHEVAAIVANLPEHVRNFALFFRYTGRRPGEYRALDRARINVGEGLIEIRSTKTGQMYWADVSEYSQIMDVLRSQAAYTARQQARFPGRAFPYFFHKPGGQAIGSIQRSWIKASAAAKCERRRFYALRASAIYDMALAGIEESLVRDLVGQQTLDAYEHYFRNTRERQHMAFEKLSKHHDERRKKSKVVGIANGTVNGTPAAKPTRKKAAR